MFVVEGNTEIFIDCLLISDKIIPLMKKVDSRILDTHIHSLSRRQQSSDSYCFESNRNARSTLN